MKLILLDNDGQAIIDKTVLPVRAVPSIERHVRTHLTLTTVTETDQEITIEILDCDTQDAEAIMRAVAVGP